MVFEKSLARPVANWNISANKLVFLEDAASTEIHLVKLFSDKQPVLFKFILPAKMAEGKVCCAYDSVTQNFIIPQERHKQSQISEPDLDSSVRNQNESSASLAAFNDQSESVTQIFNN